MTMKKTLIFAVLAFIFIGLQAQVPVNEDTKLIIYQEVVKEDAVQDTLYYRAIGWINKQYKNPQRVMRVNDTESGKIVGRHRIRMTDTDEDGNVLNSNTIVEYRFTIECKKGRYRYTFDDFTMKATSKYPLERWLDKEDPTYTPKWDEYIAQVDLKIRELIKSLKEGMLQPIIIDDSW